MLYQHIVLIDHQAKHKLSQNHGRNNTVCSSRTFKSRYNLNEPIDLAIDTKATTNWGLAITTMF